MNQPRTVEPLDLAAATLHGVAAYADRVLTETDGLWPPHRRASEARRGLKQISAECRRAHTAMTNQESP